MLFINVFGRAQSGKTTKAKELFEENVNKGLFTVLYDDDVVVDIGPSYGKPEVEVYIRTTVANISLSVSKTETNPLPIRI